MMFIPVRIYEHKYTKCSAAGPEDSYYQKVFDKTERVLLHRNTLKVLIEVPWIKCI
jgi:hypothetical protein